MEVIFMKIKIKQTFRSMWATILAVLMLLSTFSAVAVTLNVESTGETQTTVYICPSQITQFSSYVNSSTGEISSSYTLKLNVHYGSYPQDPWETFNMEKYSKSIGGKAVYTYTFTDQHNGLGELQFQIYEGTTEKYTLKPFTTWTTVDNYNGKLYNGSNWVDPSWDSSSGSDHTYERVELVGNINGNNEWESTKYPFKWNSANSRWELEIEITQSSTVKARANGDWHSGGAGEWPQKNGVNYTISDPGKYYIWVEESGTDLNVEPVSEQTYTVTFHNKGHGTAPDPQNVNSGGTVAEPPEPTETGYTFGGWFTDEGCTSAYDFNTTVTADLDLYAKWTEIKYNVKTGVKVSTDGTNYVENASLTKPTGGGDTVSAVTGTQLEAQQNDGYTFVGWATSASDDIIGTNLTLNYTPTANTTVYALYKQNYTVTIGTHTNGKITVDGNESGTTVSAGTQVTITATADDGYVFDGWTDGLTGTVNPTTMTVTSNLTVGATFKKAPYTVTLTSFPSTGGSITGKIGDSEVLTNLEGTQTISLTASANTGYKFKEWQVTGTATIASPTSAVTDATVSDACTITAVFEEIPKVANSVTLTADPATVEKNDPITLTATLNTPATGAENITYKFEKTSGSDGNFTGEVENTTSTTATFTPTATGTYKFKVTASCDGFTSVVSDEISVTVTEPVSYYIGGRFDGNKWDHAQKTMPLEKVSTGLYKYVTGKTVGQLSEQISESYGARDPLFFIHTGSGYDSATWYGTSTSTPNYHNFDKCLGESNAMTLTTFSQKDDNANNYIMFANKEDNSGPVTIWFDVNSKKLWYTIPEAVKYDIINAGTIHGSFNTEPASKASAGATVTINITPNPGYEVNTVQVVKSGEGTDGQTVEVSDSGNTRTFIMPDKTVTVSVTFKLKDYTMNGVANPSTIGGVVKCTNALGVEIETANKGAKVTFTATPVDGYSVTSWTISGSDTYTVSDDKKSVEVTVKTENVTATANYVGEYFNIVKNNSSNGSYTVTGTGVVGNTAQCGSTVTITPTANPGYELDKITVRKTVGGTTSTVDLDDKSFRMPNGDVTITVTFKSNPGTATDYKFLYNSSSSASNMTVIKGTVYENPTNTYTLTITDTDVISNIVNNSNAYFALSSTTNYTGIFTKNNDKTKVKTGTTDYVGNQWPQNNHEGGIPYYYAGVSFKDKNSIKKIVLIFENSATAPTYTVNAYATSSDKKPLAESVTLTANPTTQVIGKNVTLKATLNNVNAKIPTDAQFTYTFYRGSVELGTATGTNMAPIAPVTFNTTYNTAGTQSYTVTVSTKESDIVNYTPTDYESVTSIPVDVEYRDVIYYYAAVNPDTGAVDTRNAIPADNKVETTVSDGGTYYFSVFDNDTDTSPESVVDYTVDSANNRYCTISKSSTETGLDYLIVKCNAKCSNPVIYFDKANKTVYAVATQNIGSEKTLNSNKTVTYYFAEEYSDSTSLSDPSGGGNGMRIKYWNNSVDNSAYADVTTPVGSDGKETTALSGNSIFVRVDKFAGVSESTFPYWKDQLQRKFYIYSVELPIWATSFNFVSSSNTALTVDNTSQTGNSSCSSIVLNPNRIYCLLRYNSVNYVRGVVLDESMWSNETRGAIKSNEVTTQGFASNLVNYKTVRNDTSGNVAFNTALTAKYGTDYKHPLYFNGWYGDNDNTIVNDTRTLYGSSYFRLHDNLAMRKSYFASVQNLTDNRLSTTKKNKMGNGYLLGYNGALMPLFDYKMLNDNKTTLVNNGQLYENVQFPFYASTFNGVTTYSYDSTTDRNRLVDTSGSSPTVKVSDGFVNKGSSYGYFPFGGTDNYDTFGSGTEFDINFYMTNNGKLSNGDDIAFNFSGDDDVWVYVDGVRVLDLGGAHSVSSGTINFSDMKVYYKTAANATDKITNCNETWVTDSTYVKTVSLTDLFEANGVSFSNTDASTQHTLQMFYLERGQGESNCSISFNLPQNTGFRVNSNVTTDSVNEALVEDTMTAANKDYFNYQIANKLASDDEYSKVNSKFTSAPAKAVNVNGLTPSTTPSYPIKSLLISRDFLGTNYYLTAKNATPSDSDNTWLASVNNRTFTNLQNVNYTLSDAYAVKGASDTETSPSGRVVEVKNSQNNEDKTYIFNLLFGQSAIFESKIPNNTMIQLSQDDTISKVNAGDGNTTVITADGASTRTVSNYYSSSYSIVDDNTGLEIGSGNKSAGVTGRFYADDASDNSDMFYFANYSGKTNTSSNAMTVTYTNDVLTSKIKLAKYVKNPSAKDNFYFKVEFSKIFGENLATAKEYEDLQYTVYNSSKEVVATRTYGKAGVYFTANQYAIIEGVPVDSAYNVVEKDRAGYKFDSASKTTYKGDTEDITNYNDNKVDGATVSGAAGTTTYDEITFKNTKQAFTVKFKYYDRSVITGTTSHISTSPTTVTYSFASINDFTNEASDGTTYNLEGIISKAYSEYNFDNLIDTYTSFTGQNKAKIEAGKFKVIREGITGVTPGVTTYSDAYPNVDLGLHYDCYGRPQGTAECKVNDGEKWVTYYSGNTEIAESEASLGTSKVDSITVWLYNTLKEYTPTFFYASQNAASGELKAVDGSTDKYVATTNTSHTIPKDVYYNVRLGGVNGNTLNDAATEYLNEYGITKGYCEEVPNIVTDVTYTDENSNKKSLKFLYWASDPRGKTILSTDVAYGYRVTNNLKAYAVYGVNDFNAKGLTITPNTPDYYSNSNGKALVRLNNVMNVYGCPERDTNIKNASIIYIIDYSPVVNGKTQMDNLIDAGGFDELQAKVREVLKANEKSDSFLDSENIVIVDVTNVTFEKADYGHIDITGFNHKVVPYNEALNPGTDDIKLTNKNRVQFTTSFTKSNLSNFKMYAMLGMDYGELVSGKNSKDNSWIVSDNLLYYAFDANGNVSSIKDPILKHEFYNSTTAS